MGSANADTKKSPAPGITGTTLNPKLIIQNCLHRFVGARKAGQLADLSLSCIQAFCALAAREETRRDYQ